VDAAEPAGAHEADPDGAAGGECAAHRRRADRSLHDRGGEVARPDLARVGCEAAELLLREPDAELLETLGVPVLGFRTTELPLFYSAGGGPSVSARVDSPEEAARTAGAHWELGGAAVLLARDPDDGVEVEPLIEEALAAAATQGIHGQGVTPFVLSFLHERSEGRTLEVNRELIVANARLAAQVAVAATG